MRAIDFSPRSRAASINQRIASAAGAPVALRPAPGRSRRRRAATSPRPAGLTFSSACSNTSSGVAARRLLARCGRARRRRCARRRTSCRWLITMLMNLREHLAAVLRIRQGSRAWRDARLDMDALTPTCADLKSIVRRHQVLRALGAVLRAALATIRRRRRSRACREPCGSAPRAGP